MEDRRRGSPAAGASYAPSMTLRMLAVNGAELCAQTFGDPRDPAILLIAGAAESMDWWDDALCERLAAGSRHVIRYDQRDTGASTAYPRGAPPYDGDDLVADAIGLLDALGVDRAHVAGLSAGGILAQRLAVRHPGRLATLTLIATTPDGPGDTPLPPPSPGLSFEPVPDPDWSDRDAVIARLVADHRPYAGIDWDEDRMRAIAARAADRTRDIAASRTNPYAAAEGTSVRARLGEITAPTLVAHGTRDPLFPYAHGEALAREIPGARLLPLDGAGHEVPPPAVRDVFVPALLRHTGG